MNERIENIFKRLERDNTFDFTKSHSVISKEFEWYKSMLEVQLELIDNCQNLTVDNNKLRDALREIRDTYEKEQRTIK